MNSTAGVSAAGSSTAGKTGTKRYRVQLTALTCKRKQDAIGRDEPQLFVNGVSVYGPGDIGKGETVDLRPRSAVFASVAHMALVEADPGADDQLGVVTAIAGQAGRGPQRGEFHLPAADYEITFQVVPA
ncbi:hypothetical protein GCM10020358_69360 [Amorphoplanes nipponensis]|uniref:Uncharacterized protein n=1 Tax=Actinoplanes nipponensis TaxID=135950 RepID=A0A919JE58_9ACTN|nr:hypothetical protein [Actinoplanes nipponensis]GIE49063.1 hypothetical protein Ani05nite_25970 [Actinoplanes nipponensis]